MTDFELKKDSAAWALGFERIPVEQMGLREDGLRGGLKHFADSRGSVAAAVTPK